MNRVGIKAWVRPSTAKWVGSQARKNKISKSEFAAACLQFVKANYNVTVEDDVATVEAKR